MDRRRIAALLRERARVARAAAEIDEQLADALDETTEERAPKRSPRRVAMLTRPAGDADPAVAAQARRILRARGFG